MYNTDESESESESAHCGDSSQYTEELRKAMTEELLSTLVYKETDVILDRLFRPSMQNALSNDDSVIDFVVDYVEHECADAIQELEDLAAKAEPPALIQLQQKGVDTRAVTEELVARYLLTQEDEMEKLEEQMYKPLTQIFRAVEKVLATRTGTRREHFRQLIQSDGRILLADDPVLTDLFKLKPDFLVAEMPAATGKPNEEKFDAKTPLRWRQCPAFLEVKASFRYSPVPSCDGTCNDILIKGAEYAHAILTCRPFQMFTYGIFICGDTLCVARFDRYGTLLSPVTADIYSKEGLRILVTVLLRLVCDMSPVDLGGDPTVSLLDGHTYYGETFPRFAIKQNDRDRECWRTVGMPSWSLFHRGSSVWRVVDSGNQVLTLKSAWRSESRLDEKTIYEKIDELFENKPIPGVACAAGGGDVMVGDRPLSVFSLRQHLPALVTPGKDKVLYRVALRDVGKPVWMYRDAEELCKVIQTVLDALQALYKHNILHRDISAGNILIKIRATYHPASSPGQKESIEESDVSGPDGAQALLTDFEFAFIPRYRMKTSEHKETKRIEPKAWRQLRDEEGSLAPNDDPYPPLGHKEPSGEHNRWQTKTEIVNVEKTKAGDGLTGTTIFMAQELLNAIDSNTPCTRTLSQDFESCAYVLVYAAYMHGIEMHNSLGQCARCSNDTQGPRRAQALRAAFDSLFSATTPRGLVEKRNAQFHGGRRAIAPLLDYALHCEGSRLLGSLLEFTWNILDQHTHEPLNSFNNTAYLLGPLPQANLLDKLWRKWHAGLDHTLLLSRATTGEEELEASEKWFAQDPERRALFDKPEPVQGPKEPPEQ